MPDVLIAGGGPAGALTALLLARAGVQVHVFDRARFPRPKLCGDTLNPGALTLLGKHLDLAPLYTMSSPVRGMLLTGGASVQVCSSYPGGLQGRAITRAALDAWLLEAASAAGAHVEQGVVVLGPQISATGKVSGLRVRTAERERVHEAALTIGADGAKSKLAALAGARVPARPRRWAVGAYFSGVAGIREAGEMHVRAGHYIGIAPAPDGLANVCMVASPHRASAGWRAPEELLAATVARDELLSHRFARARRATPVTVLGPTAVDVPAAGVPGVLLAGDAAGFIDPITGDGMRFAFRGAELAAGVALDVLAGRLSPARAPAVLAAHRRHTFARKWRFNRALRRLVDYPAGLRGAKVLARLAPSIFEHVIWYAGDCGVAIDHSTHLLSTRDVSPDSRLGTRVMGV